MPYEAIVTLIIILLALVLFASEMISLDVVAIGIMVLLVATGVLTTEKAVKGFANSATLTVAAMFVLSDALIKTGIIQNIATFFSNILKQGYKTGILLMSGLVGGVSGFINNTPVVATFIPIISTASKDIGESPARYLIPLSYCAIFGGSCTLIGTSTNLLISGIAQDEGLAGFSMFTLAPLGLLFFLVGTLYLMFFSKKLVPIRTANMESDRNKGIKNFLCEIIVAENPEDKQTLQDFFENYEVLRIKNKEGSINNPESDTPLYKGDSLLVKGNLMDIRRLVNSDLFDIRETNARKQFPDEATELTEIVILPNSELVDKKLSQLDFTQHYHAAVLAIRSRGRESFENLGSITLAPGDILLLQTNHEGLQLMRHEEDAQRSPFLSMRSRSIEKLDNRKLVLVGITLLAVISLATAGILSILIAAFGGIIFLTATRVISMQDAYRAIDWKVIFLLAGALSLGEAMNSSGLTSMISRFLREVIADQYGPYVITAVLFFTAAILTEIISNNATAALLTPLVISLAASMNTNVMPLLLTIAYACSSSFLTPVSYQTNTMVYSAGTYRYLDFARVGGPLKIIFWIMATFLIPTFYSF